MSAERDREPGDRGQQLIIGSRSRRRANWNCKSSRSGSERDTHTYKERRRNMDVETLLQGFLRSVADLFSREVD